MKAQNKAAAANAANAPASVEPATNEKKRQSTASDEDLQTPALKRSRSHGSAVENGMDALLAAAAIGDAASPADTTQDTSRPPSAYSQSSPAPSPYSLPSVLQPFDIASATTSDLGQFRDALVASLTQGKDQMTRLQTFLDNGEVMLGQLEALLAQDRTEFEQQLAALPTTAAVPIKLRKS